MRKWILLLAGMLAVSISLTACTSRGYQPQLIRQIIYPAQVPVAFDTTVVCRTDGSGKDLRYEWYCDNGTINGAGSTVIWTAPAAPGRYAIALKVTDAAGNQEKRTITIEAIGFGKNVVDTATEISLRFPFMGEGIAGEQICMNPATTLEISSTSPWSAIAGYKYNWSDNGGKITAPGLKQGSADKIGWTSPGVSGNYTVKLIATDKQGNISLGHVYVYVKAPHCTDGGPCKTSE